MYFFVIGSISVWSISSPISMAVYLMGRWDVCVDVCPNSRRPKNMKSLVSVLCGLIIHFRIQYISIFYHGSSPGGDARKRRVQRCSAQLLATSAEPASMPVHACPTYAAPSPTRPSSHSRQGLFESYYYLGKFSRRVYNQGYSTYLSVGMYIEVSYEGPTVFVYHVPELPIPDI